MRRTGLSGLATLPTAVAVAMAVIDVITGFARLVPQLHGFIDVLFALSGVYAMKKHRPQDSGDARARQYADDYERTMRSFGEAAAGALQQSGGRDGGRVGQSA